MVQYYVLRDHPVTSVHGCEIKDSSVHTAHLATQTMIELNNNFRHCKRSSQKVNLHDISFLNQPTVVLHV
jgi:hypothetical protein